MDKDRNHIVKMWALVLQIGITAIAPIILCVCLGLWLKSSFQLDWMLALVILGIVSGFVAAFRLAANQAGDDDEATKLITGIYDRKKDLQSELEEDAELEDLKQEYEELNSHREEF